MISWMILKGLSLRYSVDIKGLNNLRLREKVGILFLPNHPAEIDPIIVGGVLTPKFDPRPLVISHSYYLRGARFFMRLYRALPIPIFGSSANSWKRNQLKKCIGQVRAGLNRGENFLIYPAGKLKHEGDELIGGSSFVHRVLEVCPHVQVVLIRTSGLWGSLFSRAIIGETPDFWEVLWYSIKILLKNGIFFAPRRRVTVEIEKAGEEFPYKSSRLELNKYLERWYNHYLNERGERVEKEELYRVPFGAIPKKSPLQAGKKGAKKRSVDALEISERIKDDLYRELKKFSTVTEIHEEMKLSKDLGLDSLDIANVLAFLDQRYDADATHLEQMHSVHDLLELIATQGRCSPSGFNDSNTKFYEWPQEDSRPEVRVPQGETLSECFLNSCDRMGKTAACGDDSTKIMNYREVKLAVILFARKLSKLPDKYIGVLLPSSLGCYIIILAILFAGKIPVILNWTAGRRSLNFAKNLLELKTIFTSLRFLEMVDSLELGDLEDHITLVEEVVKTFSSFNKITSFFLSLRKGKALKRYFGLGCIKGSDPALVLFTSGTESYPKAVPLSHTNLLSNQRATVEMVKIETSDILYGVLPPFHSFGCSITGLLPLLSGLRVFYAPDPTDAHGMARDCLLRKVTILCCAPSFYRNLFRAATPHQLQSVRIIVSGAEKAPAELFEHAKQLGKRMIEGYGITECSPIVTINCSGQEAKGVGYPLKGVELCLIHPDTENRVTDGRRGEICIRGSNVFSGYLGESSSNPFVKIDGKRWYRSGDLGKINPDGSLILDGRSKRFVKIGGEMVSLPSLEEELINFAKNQGLIEREEVSTQLAIGVKEGERSTLILFATFAITRELVNRALRDAGFSRLVKISKTCQIRAIPLTGTGKIQLGKLRDLIHAQDV